MRIALCLLAVAVGLSGCGPSPEDRARYNKQLQTVWSCAASNGVSPPVNLARRYRAGGGVKSNKIEIIPSPKVSSATAIAINQCVERTAGPQPVIPKGQVKTFFDDVYIGATPESLGKVLVLGKATEYLRKTEAAYGSWSVNRSSPRTARTTMSPEGQRAVILNCKDRLGVRGKARIGIYEAEPGSGGGTVLRILSSGWVTPKKAERINACADRALGRAPTSGSVATTRRSTVAAAPARPATRSSGLCPKHASVLYGGTSYCVGN
ncbi:hypothetical protein [uncultured Roseovarius sp.]|uniref:hypothetical protein n=1 Tax=uncultured Roseovarius sp. TaxID=293344 RepID=UPI0026060745|nr:hypothetical protein [uncultured Roseovarius sp.]